MKVLITGNMGYIGPVLVRHLRHTHPDWILEGFDSGYFAHCLTTPGALPETLLDRQHFGDVRKLPPELLEGVDAVVELAAISNDPMGAKFEAVTDQINHRACVSIAELARDAGVKAVVFASSCSIYGAAEGGPRTEMDAINPLTAYARSKVATEQGLKQLDLGKMKATCLRFATACGMSPRLRLDLVLNDFVACALTSGEITVLSDGTPWRPLIDVADMARAIEWAIIRDAAEGGQYLVCNAGCDEWNWQVKDLAQAVAAAVPDTSVSINTDAPPDKRSYQVDFGLFKRLAPNHQPLTKLDDSIVRLRDGLRAIGFADAEFRGSQNIRLKVLERHMETGRLSANLEWAGA
jgi:nucleoside-diphosphate-sugar epimerase